MNAGDALRNNLTSVINSVVPGKERRSPTKSGRKDSSVESSRMMHHRDMRSFLSNHDT